MRQNPISPPVSNMFQNMFLFIFIHLSTLSFPQIYRQGEISFPFPVVPLLVKTVCSDFFYPNENEAVLFIWNLYFTVFYEIDSFHLEIEIFGSTSKLQKSSPNLLALFLHC